MKNKLRSGKTEAGLVRKNERVDQTADYDKSKVCKVSEQQKKSKCLLDLSL